MTNNAVQGMLFGATDGASEPDAYGVPDELRLCALNVNSPSRTRAQGIVDWLLGSRSNVLVLTEMQPSDGGRHILSCLEAEGFAVTCPPGWSGGPYFAAIASRGFVAQATQAVAFDPRVVAADLFAGSKAIRLVGVYGPTNGMTGDSSRRRRQFQNQFLEFVRNISTPALCIAGDLNVVEPGHRPHLPSFEQHDYDFYTSLLQLELRDAYRVLDPSGTDHSWISARFGNQRLDHSLVGTEAGIIKSCEYDHSTRRDGLSDHAALRTTIALT